MKGHEIAKIANCLSGMKLTAELFPIYLPMRKILRGIEQDRDELVRKFREDWGEEINAVEEMRKTGQVEGHEEYLAAEKAGSDCIQALYDADYPVEYNRLTMDQFLSATKDSKLTNEEAAVLAEYLV